MVVNVLQDPQISNMHPFKKWNKHIPFFFDFALALISHLIFLINKHEAYPLQYSYVQCSFFYCDTFLTTRFGSIFIIANISESWNIFFLPDCECSWFPSWYLAIKRISLNESYWCSIYFHICRLVLFMFGQMSPAVQIPHLSPLCLLVFKKDSCSW